jgi:hypothetical protein
MNNLRRLSLSMILISVLSVAAFAGETSSPPCAPPDPGETSSPPCAAAQITQDDSVALGQTSATASSSAADELSAAKLAIDILESVLLIF